MTRRNSSRSKSGRSNAPGTSNGLNC
jgi:hypothetical protein